MKVKLCVVGTREFVCTNDTLLCTIGVLVENVLACSVAEILPVRR